MSTRYVRTRLNIVTSLNSDYSRPFVDEEWEDTFSLEETPFIPIEAATTGTTVVLSNLASASLFAVYNEDSTNYVTAAWTSSGTANIVRIEAGGWLYLGGGTSCVTVASNLLLTADTAAVECRVFYGGT